MRWLEFSSTILNRDDNNDYPEENGEPAFVMVGDIIRSSLSGKATQNPQEAVRIY